jgi:HlyD family secretion protein
VLWIRRGASQKNDLLQVFTVERGNLVATVATTGEIYAPRKAELGFDVNRIPLIAINVTSGQQVKAGDVLARIDPTALERAVTQAEAELTVAQDNLEKAQNPYTELDLTQAKLAVTQAELALEDAKKGLEKAQDPYTELDVIQARLAVTQSQTALASAQENLDTLRNPDIEAAQIAVRDAAAALKSAQNQLTVTQSDPSNAAQLRTLEYEATWYRNNYWAAQEKFKKGQINQQKLDWEYSNMLAAEEKLKVAQVRAESALSNAQDQVTKAQQAHKEASANLAELKKGPAPIELNRAQNQVAQAEYNLEKARADLAKIEAGPAPTELNRAQNQVAQAEYNLEKARADLAEIEAGPDPKDIAVVQARAVSAQATLEEAQATLEAATMTAPFDGTVISVGAQVGDLVSSNTIIVTLADLSNLRVKATVDETDISNVEIGQEVGITFDAFPGRRFRGQVLEVPLEGKLTQNVLTYEVPVSLEGAAGVALKPGMTANVSIVVGRLENVLLVPAMAVQQGDEGNLVMVQDSPQGPAVETQVVVGLSDGTYVEVKRGLNEGDQVVVEYKPPQAEQTGSRGFEPMMPSGGRGMGR